MKIKIVKMNKVVSQVGQAALMAIFGYEVGQRNEQEVIVKLEKSEEKNEKKVDNEKDMLVFVVFLLIILMILLVIVIIIMKGRSRRRAVAARV